MSSSLKKLAFTPVPYSALVSPGKRRREEALATLRQSYMDGLCGFGAILVRPTDNLFPWKALAGTEQFLEELFTPSVWEMVQRAGRSKGGQVGATGLGEEQYFGYQDKSISQYLHVSTDGKPEVLKQLSTSPDFLWLGNGMFEVALQVILALEAPCGREIGSVAAEMSQHPETHTTYRLIEQPPRGTLGAHKDTSMASVVMAKPGYLLLMNDEWLEVQIEPFSGEGIVFVINIGKVGSMMLTGDIRLATTHCVRTLERRRNLAFFVHSKKQSRWKRPVSADIPSKHLKKGGSIHAFALDDFAAHGVVEDIPPFE